MNWMRAVAGVLVLWAGTAWGATLTWNANSETDVAGYRVYQCTMTPCTKTSGTASPLATLGKVTSFTIGTPAVTTYYFTTAYDFANNESNSSSSVTFTATGSTSTSTGSATISASSTSVQPGASVSVTVSNGPGNTTDWVGLYASTAPNDSSGLLAWKYLNGAQTVPSSGQTAATLTFTMPSTAGTYEFRFFTKNTYTLLATSADVVSSITSTSSPAISVSSTSVQPGASVSVTVSNGPGKTSDWVGLFASTAPNDSSGLLAWKYLSGTQIPPSSGQTAATLTFTMPSTAGTYEFRFFTNNAYTLLATSPDVVSSITSTSSPKISVSSTSVQRGYSVSVTVSNGPGNRTDWVGLFESGAPNNVQSIVAWKYLNGAQTAPSSGQTSTTLTFTMPSYAQTYQFRFFSNDGYTLLATSPNVVTY